MVARLVVLSTSVRRGTETHERLLLGVTWVRVQCEIVLSFFLVLTLLSWSDGSLDFSSLVLTFRSVDG